MKITDLFNKEWSQDTQNFADVMVEAILNEENSRLNSVQQASIFRELLCEAITNSESFELTTEVEDRLLSMAAVYSIFIDMNAEGEIILGQDEQGEDIIVAKD